MNISNWILVGVLLQSMNMSAQQATESPIGTSGNVGTSPLPASPRLQSRTTDQVVDSFIEREHSLMQELSDRTPVVETYLQTLKSDPGLGPVPNGDRYFLGRFDMGETDRKDYLKQDGKSMKARVLGGFDKLYKLQYKPVGFCWMVYADRTEFDRQHYEFRYIRREFLGEVRTLVFQVTPKDAARGRFIGQVWVEDQNDNIVRLNGTFTNAPSNTYFFHLDSWRLNLIPGYWVPAYIYSEEGDSSAGAKNKFSFKAQTRLWGYSLKRQSDEDQLTEIQVDNARDASVASQDASPLQAQRRWQQQAEDNVVERLTSAGLLAPEGEVDHVLQTVVNNLEVTNNIDLPRPVRVRVLITSPLETFSIGNTIVISRGLVDVLPDEATLAAFLAHELAHIILGHNLGTRYAFSDLMLFSDEFTYSNMGFKHTLEDEAAADKKAIQLLVNSPYGHNLGTVGLFLRLLQMRAPALPALLTTHLGNSLGKGGAIMRLLPIASEGPSLDVLKLDQLAARPLGGRVRVNPWNDKAEMLRATPVVITSARDKMPFEVTPFFPWLSRLESPSSASALPGGNVAPAD